MKLALAQINPTVGDIAGNCQLIRRQIAAARQAGAGVVLFPELAVIGYPPRDLLLKPAVIEDCQKAVQQIAADCTDIAAVVGFPRRFDGEPGRLLQNAAAVCHGGRIVQVAVKSLLPTYDVFDEHRYFEPAPHSQACELAGMKLGISICEDLWNERDIFPHRLYHESPVDDLAAAGAQIIINCSASPFVVGKQAFRLKLMGHIAKRLHTPLIYCNQVGGNDELIFDGNSCAFDAAGELIAHAKAFEEDLLLIDTDNASSLKPHPSSLHHDLYHALVLGLRDYCRKCGFKSIVLGLSGGIDSAVTAALAVAALGKDNVHGIAMPTRYSSTGSVDDARKLAQNLGIRFDVIAIENARVAVEEMVQPLFAGTAPGIAEENIQARLRGNLLMAVSNKFGSLLVTTGNKSELAVGYCTLYGDMSGGLAVISDVPKTMVYELAKWINTPDCPLHQQFGGPIIPGDSITKPPSAELRENQTDQDSLPPYEMLDPIIERYVEREQSQRQIIAETGFPPEVVQRMVNLIDRNEYKRKQAAPGLKVTGRAFGIGRRMPIAQRYRNSD
ncbi:MAG: NAD+ synthase [Phycisphaeraceae bacterium]|nr:NAD+ synthase [Phycisphaeraceae bacterium]